MTNKKASAWSLKSSGKTQLEDWIVARKKSLFESILHHSSTPKIFGTERPINGLAFFWVIEL